MIFVEASAIVARLTLEADATRIVDRLEAYDRRSTSPIAIFEASLGIVKAAIKRPGGVRGGPAFLRAANVGTLPIGAGDAHSALHAHARYGMVAAIQPDSIWATALRTPSPASHSAKLLFTGDDFSKTYINA